MTTSGTLTDILLPLQELMNQAGDTWYVHVLAAYPEYRGKSLGTMLLRFVDRLAERADKQGISLIVSGTNVEARRLYERCGYTEIAGRPMVKEDWRHPGVDWVLLKKG